VHGWLGSEVASSIAVPLQLLAVGAVVNSLGYLPLAFLQASGQAHLAAKLHIAEIPATFLITWTLVSQFGLLGAAIAWLTRVVVDSVLLFILAGRVENQIFVGVGEAASALVILVLAILGAAVSSTIEMLPLRIIAIALIIGTSLVLGWRLSLTAGDRTILAAMARRRRFA
jgi:O-antigen/teichoic acid export membrane protein